MFPLAGKIFFILYLFFLLGLGSIAAAVKYTMGKNAYGYSGFGDIFVFLFFGLLSVCGTYFLYVHIYGLYYFFSSLFHWTVKYWEY